MSILIGLGYKARRGKDTVANAIIEARGGQYDIRRYAFGDALREEVEAAMFEDWAHYRAPSPHFGDTHTVYDAPSPSRLAENLCDKVGVPFDPTAVIEPNYPFTKQRALYQWWGTELRRNVDPFYWVKKLRERIERDNPRFAIITDVRFRNEISYIHSMEGYTVKVDRRGYEEKLSATQSKHVSEVELDSADDTVWDYSLSGAEGDVEDLKRQGIAMFDSIVESLSFPLMDQLLFLSQVTQG